MLVRIAFVASIVLASVAQSGCCGTPWGGCWPCGKNWCECSCGEVFWSEWYSIPPECCDQCDDCGYFTGKKRPDNLYSHGNDYQGWCEKRQMHGMRSTEYAESIPAGPVSQPTPAPTPSQGEPYSPREAAPEPMPGPVEDMPTTRRMPRDKYGRPIAYHQPAPRGQQRLIEQASRAWYADRSGEVDSPPPTRTLARPPRTRLFSR